MITIKSEPSTPNLTRGQPDTITIQGECDGEGLSVTFEASLKELEKAICISQQERLMPNDWHGQPNSKEMI